MGHFYNPPQPFIGGAQPSAPRVGVPTGAIVNPPPTALGGPLVAIIEAAAIAQPNPWTYSFQGSLQPFGRRTLSPGVPGQSINQPPQVRPGQLAQVDLINSMQPNPWTYTFMGGLQPFDTRKKTAPSIDQPQPSTVGGPYAMTAELLSIAQPNPWTYTFMGGRQPYEPLRIFADQLAVVVSSQVYVAPGSLSALNRIVATWQPDPWLYAGMGSQVAYKASQLTPGVPGQSVDQPPPTPGGPAVLISEAAQIAQPDPWTYRFFGASQPFDPRRLSAGVPGQSISAPPTSRPGQLAQLDLILTTWQPDPWIYAGLGARQAYMAKQITPGVPGQSIDNPPFTQGGPLAIKLQQATFADPAWNGAAWPYLFMGRTQPYAPGVNPGFLAVAATDPPYTIRSQTPAFQAIMRAWDPPPYNFSNAMYATKISSFTGVIVNPPPPSSPGRTAAMQAIVRAWDPPPFDFNVKMYASGQTKWWVTQARKPTARGYIIL